MGAYRATVTRQTDTHIWFRFVQETVGDGFVERGDASVNAGDTIVVDSLTPGVWYLADVLGSD